MPRTQNYGQAHSVFGLLQDLVDGFVSRAAFPNQSTFIQHAYHGRAVTITPDFDPAIFDPGSDIGIFFSKSVQLGFSCLCGLLGRWRRRINQVETKGNGMLAKSVSPTWQDKCNPQSPL